jgi:hypothetical protein
MENEKTVGNKTSVGITTTWMMEPGQERIVANRIQEILKRNTITMKYIPLNSVFILLLLVQCSPTVSNPKTED